jgi:hypothetical protein
MFNDISLMKKLKFNMKKSNPDILHEIAIIYFSIIFSASSRSMFKIIVSKKIALLRLKSPISQKQSKIKNDVIP